MEKCTSNKDAISNIATKKPGKTITSPQTRIILSYQQYQDAPCYKRILLDALPFNASLLYKVPSFQLRGDSLWTGEGCTMQLRRAVAGFLNGYFSTHERRIKTRA